MKASMPILWKRETWGKHLKKLSEEYTEVCEELHDMIVGNGDAKRLNSELLDLIQVCIGTIEATGEDVPEAIRTHVDKLMGRGWSVKGWILLDVKMGVGHDSVQDVQKTT